MRRIVPLLASLLLAAAAHATEWIEKPELGRQFQAAGLAGTFVLYDAGADRMTVYDRKRAETRFTPASTFKVFNSLAGFDSGAVRDADEVLPYGGKPQWRAEWEHDTNLREAMRISSVPIYQEVARRVGLERMRGYIGAVGYGNGDIGQVVDRFWLDGPLAISPAEQVRFLARLAERRLPFSPRAMALTREIMQIERTPEYALFAKTGWAANTDPDIGWWVGWVERSGKTYAFALNVDLPEGSGDKRVALGRRCLVALGIL